MMETPAERSARIYELHHSSGKSCAEIGQMEGVTAQRIRQIIDKEQRKRDNPPPKEKPMPDYARDYHQLSVRLRNVMEFEKIPIDEYGVPLFGEINKTDAEWLRFPNFGRKSLNELKEYLQRWDFHGVQAEHEQRQREAFMAQHLADSMELALKLFPPFEGENLSQWMKRLRAWGNKT